MTGQSVDQKNLSGLGQLAGSGFPCCRSRKTVQVEAPQLPACVEIAEIPLVAPVAPGPERLRGDPAIDRAEEYQRSWASQPLWAWV
jgi:hypothetical protein